MKCCWFFVFAAFAASFACSAEERAGTAVDCAEVYDAIPHGTLLDLLDPTAAADDRTKAVREYQRLSAIKECPEFGYTLGQLYRLGPTLPGNPLSQDIPKARELIRAMAEAGYVNAYADLAEMEMLHGEYRESMKWTQVYLYLVKNTQQPMMKDGDDIQFSRSAYNGHLLTRAEVVWKWMKPALPRKVVREDLGGYLDKHEEAIKRVHDQQHGLSRGYSGWGVGASQIRAAPECYLNIDNRIGAATAAFIVEVMPSGKIGRTVLENFVPTAKAADKLKAECLSKYEYEPFDGTQSTTTRISIMYGSSEGPSLRRH